VRIKLVLAFSTKEEYGEVYEEEMLGRQECGGKLCNKYTLYAVYVVRMEKLIRYTIYQMSSEG